MKKTALLAAAAIMSAAAPAAAGGYLGVQYNNGDAELFSSADFDAWRAEGAYGFAFSPNIHAQIDGEYGSLDAGTGTVDTWSVGGHLWWQADKWRLGVGTALVNIGDVFEVEEQVYGVEGAYDIGESWRVSGSVTQGTAETSPSSEVDTENTDLGLSYYATPNIRLDASYGFGDVNGIDTTSYGIGAEFMPWSAPVSLTVAWNQYELDILSAGSETLQVGVRWNFGSETLRDRDNATPFHLDTGFNDRLFGFF